jgi:hypothetical protein
VAAVAARRGGKVSSSVGSDDSRRGRIWIERYGELMRYAAGEGRMPREGAEIAEENRLAGWVRYQRRREDKKVMLFWQRELLNQVPGFLWDPLAEQWEQTNRQLETFLVMRRRVPRYRSTDEAERALAAWVHKQRYLHARGELSAHRVAALRELPFRIL